jgi:hypothetical protein
MNDIKQSNFVDSLDKNLANIDLNNHEWTKFIVSVVEDILAEREKEELNSLSVEYFRKFLKVSFYVAEKTNFLDHKLEEFYKMCNLYADVAHSQISRDKNRIMTEYLLKNLAGRFSDLLFKKTGSKDWLSAQYESFVSASDAARSLIWKDPNANLEYFALRNAAGVAKTEFDITHDLEEKKMHAKRMENVLVRALGLLGEFEFEKRMYTNTMIGETYVSHFRLDSNKKHLIQAAEFFKSAAHQARQLGEYSKEVKLHIKEKESLLQVYDLTGQEKFLEMLVFPLMKLLEVVDCTISGYKEEAYNDKMHTLVNLGNISFFLFNRTNKPHYARVAYKSFSVLADMQKENPSKYLLKSMHNAALAASKLSSLTTNRNWEVEEYKINSEILKMYDSGWFDDVCNDNGSAQYNAALYKEINKVRHNAEFFNKLDNSVSPAKYLQQVYSP